MIATASTLGIERQLFGSCAASLSASHAGGLPCNGRNAQSAQWTTGQVAVCCLQLPAASVSYVQSLHLLAIACLGEIARLLMLHPLQHGRECEAHTDHANRHRVVRAMSRLPAHNHGAICRRKRLGDRPSWIFPTLLCLGYRH